MSLRLEAVLRLDTPRFGCSFSRRLPLRRRGTPYYLTAFMLAAALSAHAQETPQATAATEAELPSSSPCASCLTASSGSIVATYSWMGLTPNPVKIVGTAPEGAIVNSLYLSRIAPSARWQVVRIYIKHGATGWEELLLDPPNPSMGYYGVLHDSSNPDVLFHGQPVSGEPWIVWTESVVYAPSEKLELDVTFNWTLPPPPSTPDYRGQFEAADFSWRGWALDARDSSKTLSVYLTVDRPCDRSAFEDLKKFDVPTLILHGDDDQIGPLQTLRCCLPRSSRTLRSRSTRARRMGCAPRSKIR